MILLFFCEGLKDLNIQYEKQQLGLPTRATVEFITHKRSTIQNRLTQKSYSQDNLYYRHIAIQCVFTSTIHGY